MKLKMCLLFLTMIFAINCIPVFGYETDDTRDMQYKKMLDTLVALGIMESTSAESFDPDAPITRAEIVVLATRLLGVDTIEISGDSDEFYDVPPEHEAYSEIIVAYKMGIISGVGNDRFDPQGSASYGQAVKILVCTLGYEQMAQQNGGYPMGYLTVGIRIGILKGNLPSDTSVFTRRSAVEIVYRALETDIVDASYYLYDGSAVEKVVGGKTLLKDKLDIHTVRGIVTQNNITGLQSPNGVSKGMVAIGDEIFSVGNTNIAKYLGYSVKAYYREFGDINEIIFFSDVNKYNDVLVLNDKDNLQINYADGKFTISYEKNRRQLEISLPGTCIYNGVLVNASDVQGKLLPCLKDKTVSLTLIDNDRHGDYDVVSIRAYTSVLISNVSVANERISYYSYSSSGVVQMTELDLSNERDVEYTVCDADGKRISFDELVAKDVLSIHYDLSEKVYELYVSKDKVTGELFEISDDGFGIKVTDEASNTSDGDNVKTYKKIPAFPEELLQLGLNSTFYLDYNGYITAYELSNSLSGDYGLLMDFDMQSTGINSYPEFKILTSEGKVVILQSEKKITAYNPNTGKVEKTDVSSLIATGVTPDRTSDGYDKKYDYMLWHKDNKANFAYETKVNDNEKPFYYRPWLSDKDKSDIASRKMVYYKTGINGRINTIIVPDIPSTTHNKLSLLNADGRYSYNYISGGRIAVDPYAGDRTTVGLVDYVKLAEDAKVFSAVALDYSEENFNVTDVKIIKTANSKMWMYSVEGSLDARLVLRYAPLPYEWDNKMPYVVVKSVIPKDDGTYQLKGFSNGAEYSDTILPNTRLVERKLSSTNDSYTKVTSNNILDFVSARFGGGELPCYDWSTFAGSDHPYADETSLHTGDIILVGKDRRNEICYVEVAMRAEDCVMLPPADKASYYNRMASDTMKKGVVMKRSLSGEVLVNSVGEYFSNARRITTLPPNYKLAALYYDTFVPYDFSKCKSVWIYDYRRGTMHSASHNDIMVGDVLMIDGSAIAPTDCIILRNNPNEPKFSYWSGEGEETPGDDYTGDVNVDFEGFTPASDGLIYLRPRNGLLNGQGYKLGVYDDTNNQGGTNPVYIIERPGSPGNYCAVMPNVSTTANYIPSNPKVSARPLLPREINVSFSNPRSASGEEDIVVEFDYAASRANSQGNITLRNSENATFFKIDLTENEASTNSRLIYSYPFVKDANKFATLKLVVKRNTKTVDIYVDGNLKVMDAPVTEANFTDFIKVCFTQESDENKKQAGDVYVDNVKIYEQTSVDTSGIRVTYPRHYNSDSCQDAGLIRSTDANQHYDAMIYVKNAANKTIRIEQKLYNADGDFVTSTQSDHTINDNDEHEIKNIFETPSAIANGWRIETSVLDAATSESLLTSTAVIKKTSGQIEYLINEDFNGFEAGTLNGVRTGVLNKVNWYLDGEAKGTSNADPKKAIELVQNPKDGAESTDMCILIPAYSNVANQRSFHVRFPAYEFAMGDAADDSVVVFEWDIMYTASLDRFFGLSLRTDLEGTTSGTKIKQYDTLYNGGSSDKVGEFHNFKMVINKADWKYKVYIDNAEVASDNISLNNIKPLQALLINIPNTLEKDQDAKVYMDNFKIYEAPQELLPEILN